MAMIPAALSEMGPANMTPSIPINSGNIRTRGSRKIICLVMARKIPREAFPMEVKKLEVTGCIPLKKVANRNIRKNFTENS